MGLLQCVVLESDQQGDSQAQQGSHGIPIDEFLIKMRGSERAKHKEIGHILTPFIYSHCVGVCLFVLNKFLLYNLLKGSTGLAGMPSLRPPLPAILLPFTTGLLSGQTFLTGRVSIQNRYSRVLFVFLCVRVCVCVVLCCCAFSFYNRRTLAYLSHWAAGIRTALPAVYY